MKRTLIALSSLLVIGLIIFFGFIPSYLDSSMNRHTGSDIIPSEKASEFHQTLFVSDLHNDALLWGRDLRKKNQIGLTDIPRLQAGNMALQGFSVVTKTPFGLNIERNDDKSDMIFWGGMAQAWPPSALNSLLERALMMAGKLEKLAAEDNTFMMVRSQSDLRRFIEARKNDPTLLAGWLTLEGAHAMEADLANLDKLYDAGYRMIAPTHFFDTAISGSAHGIEKYGLTPLGKEWVKQMEDKSMIIDLAHASHKAFDDIIALSTRPVIVSHTGIKGTCPNNRNLSDEQLKAVASTGGLIGIGFWPTAVCGSDVNAIVNAIIYTANLIGANHVALGSDYDGAVQSPIDGTQLNHITHALLNAGMPESEIALVMGGNIERLLLENLPKN